MFSNKYVGVDVGGGTRTVKPKLGADSEHQLFP